jgi:large subunit ribosomal protein L1
MAIHGKRYNEAVKQVDAKRHYKIGDAVDLLKKLPKTKFDETIELAFKLGVDAKQSDQMVRGTVALPHGSGKKVRVVVFAKGEAAQAAKDAGADIVGFEDLVKKCQEGWTEFDVAVATPEAMQEVRKLGKVLGPKGLMPNPKTGTVTEDTAKAVREVKAGRVEFKMDKAANVHVSFGKLSFEGKAIEENARAVINALVHAKPPTAKGHFIESCTLSSAMSPGIRIDHHEFSVSAS